MNPRLQKVFCRTCGKEFETDFLEYHGEVCSKACWEELWWRQTLSMIGKPYRPRGSENAP